MRVLRSGPRPGLLCRPVSIQVHVVGARPNFIKAASVVEALADRGAPLHLVHTGQHYEPALSQIFFDQLELPEPDSNLGIGSGTHAQQTAALLVALEDLFVELDPARIVVYGDVNSTLAATLSAAKLHIPVAHVEAGLRSFDRSMPEEINRVVTDALADLHFTTSPEAEPQLISEGVARDGIHFVGNSMIDTLRRISDRIDTEAIRSLFELDGDYAVCTLHRPANVDDPDVALDLVEALRRVSEMIPIVAPLHPRGRAAMEAAGIGLMPNVTLSKPIGYVEFIALLSAASLVLTDSGGIQEETTVLGVPCLTLRDNTERPITTTVGTNTLVGRDPERITSAARSALNSPGQGKVPPLWDGRAGVRIAELLSRDLAAHVSPKSE